MMIPFGCWRGRQQQQRFIIFVDVIFASEPSEVKILCRPQQLQKTFSFKPSTLN
jgi:hypothetical protein